MARMDGGARPRLLEAGLHLFREQGFEKTTAVEIAARANVTERTFFRHFKDKREVLFDGEAVLREALLESMSTAAPELGPMDTLFRAYRSVLPLLQGNRAFAVPRQEVISATPALQERELAKHAALADALAEALEARGASHQRAFLASRIGMAAFVYATAAWLEDSTDSLAKGLETVERELKVLSTSR